MHYRIEYDTSEGNGVPAPMETFNSTVNSTEIIEIAVRAAMKFNSGEHSRLLKQPCFWILMSIVGFVVSAILVDFCRPFSYEKGKIYSIEDSFDRCDRFQLHPEVRAYFTDARLRIEEHNPTAFRHYDREKAEARKMEEEKMNWTRVIREAEEGRCSEDTVVNSAEELESSKKLL